MDWAAVRQEAICPDEGGVHMLPEDSERGLLWSYEGPLEAMSQHRTQRVGAAAAGSTYDDGEVRISQYYSEHDLIR